MAAKDVKFVGDALPGVGKNFLFLPQSITDDTKE